jgi:hypothetical protein
VKKEGDGHSQPERTRGTPRARTSGPIPLLTFLPQLVYYESIKRELQIRPTYDCRCDERLKPKTEDSTRLAYTGFHG